MLKKAVGMLALACIVASCGMNTSAKQSNAGEKSKTEFGAAITGKRAMSYTTLISQMADRDSMPALVKGEVNKVCQVKGCWMTLKADDPSVPEMRVTFKDYAFFMPKDLGGSNVLIEGNAYRTVTSVDDLRHFAKDAGKSDEEIAKITEPLEELTFEAAGVRILK